VTTSGRHVRIDGNELWVEDLGEPGAPVVLLVSGSDSHCLRWLPEIVDPLLGAGHRVVRYDHRDSGRSSDVDPDLPYTLEDLTTDAVAVLDELGVATAHVVGRSMGGAIGQLLALDHPARVRSLTLVGSSPGLGDHRLPFADDALVDAMAERLFAPPPRDRLDRIAWVVEGSRLFAGTRYPFDEQAEVLLAASEVDLGWHPESGHGIAVNASPSRLDRIDAIAVPTLVVHGSADPVFPLAHATETAARIPAGTLWVVEGLGHETPAPFLAELAPRLLEHLAAAG